MKSKNITKLNGLLFWDSSLKVFYINNTKDDTQISVGIDEKHHCLNCGATKIKTNKCEYCGM